MFAHDPNCARGELSAFLLHNAASLFSFPGLHQSHPECPAPSPAHQVCLAIGGTGWGCWQRSLRMFPSSHAFGSLRPRSRSQW